MEPTFRDLIVTRGDAVVVPTFGFIRPALPPTAPPPRELENVTIPLQRIPSLRDLRVDFSLPEVGLWDGVGEHEFGILAAENLAATYATIPLPREQWPEKKSALVQFVRPPRASAGTPPGGAGASSPILALHDRRWDLNHGPSNWYLWRKSPRDAHLLDPPEQGGGLTLGVDGGTGGGRQPYRVADYDLHYSPNVVLSKKGQPWCTEKFERLHAACVYQVYLAGAELWVMPDQWTYTLEVVNKGASASERADPTEKLKVSEIRVRGQERLGDGN